MNDNYHVVGFTSNDVLTGVGFRILSLSQHVQKSMLALTQIYGPLRPAIQKGLLVEEQVEILFLADVMNFDAAENYRRRYGEQYDELDFFNDVALRLCQQYGIRIPPVLKTIAKTELPDPHILGASLRVRNVRPRDGQS